MYEIPTDQLREGIRGVKEWYVDYLVAEMKKDAGDVVILKTVYYPLAPSRCKSTNMRRRLVRNTAHSNDNADDTRDPYRERCVMYCA